MNKDNQQASSVQEKLQRLAVRRTLKWVEMVVILIL